MDCFSSANLTTSFVICWEKIEKKEKKNLFIAKFG